MNIRISTVRSWLRVGAAIWVWLFPRKQRIELVNVLNDEQQITLRIAPKTKAGHAATVEGVPAWLSSDTAVLQVQTAADGMSAIAVAKGLGTATVTVSADADLGAGVVLIEASADFEVVAAQAAALGLEVGTPEAQA